jgi:protein-S-isoprenylcysteine O-methyltransferase Ste14
MALKEEFEKVGNWLFRWRSYLPLLLAVIILAGMRNFKYPGDSHYWDRVWEILCLAISFFGLAIRSYTIGHTPNGTSERNTYSQEAKSLNTTGMYSIVRHPLYLGNFFCWLGVSMFPCVWPVSVIVILVFWIYYERIMFAEEEFLRGKFGKEYEKWTNKTPAFLPRLRNWIPNVLPFSLRNVLKREYSGFFAIIVSFTFLEIIGDIFAEGELELDPMWGALFLFGMITYLSLRTLKKKTGFLNVAGR